MIFLRNLLWVDCLAGASVGVVVLAFSSGLSRIEGLPQSVLLVTGVANVLYACYSGALVVRARRPIGLIVLLVVANLAWVLVCLGLAVVFWDDATVLGRVHLLGEAGFVGALAAIEWSQRDRLANAP